MWNKARRIVQDNIPSSEVDLSGIEELRLVERGHGHSLIDIDNSEGRLELNLDALGGKERQEFVGEIVETFETQHRLFSGDPNKVRKATSLALSEGEIEETIEFSGTTSAVHIYDFSKGACLSTGRGVSGASLGMRWMSIKKILLRIMLITL